MAGMDPIHPGEILLTEFLEPMGISQYRLAKDLDVPQTRIADIVKGRRSITADTALRLAKYFGMSDSFWINLQAHYDIEVERDRLAELSMSGPWCYRCAQRPPSPASVTALGPSPFSSVFSTSRHANFSPMPRT